MSPTTIAYGYLAIAIICEVIGTTFLMKSEQFTRLVPTLLMGALYAVPFYLMAQTLKTIPLGIAYAAVARTRTRTDITCWCGAIQATS